MNRAVETGVLTLQSFHAAFPLLHDWFPFRRLNDVQAVRTVNPLRKRVPVILVAGLSFVLPIGIKLDCRFRLK
jgi:hypothetical protein